MGAEHEQARNPISDHLDLRLPCCLGKPSWSLKPLRVRGLWICGVSRRNSGDGTAEVRSACRWRELQCHRRDTNRCFESAGICCGGRCNTRSALCLFQSRSKQRRCVLFWKCNIQWILWIIARRLLFYLCQWQPLERHTDRSVFCRWRQHHRRQRHPHFDVAANGSVRRSFASPSSAHPAAIWLRCFGARTICISMEEAPAKSRGLSVVLLDAASSATPTS
jgi:hypothetical protein